MPILLFFIAFAFAGFDDLRTLQEKTFKRNNSYCLIGNRRIEIQIRSTSQFTEPHEKSYGEYFLYEDQEVVNLLPLNSDKLHSYRLFEGSSIICSKSLGFKVGSEKVAILFLQENRPYKDKLAIQLFNTNSITPAEVIETNYLTEDAEVSPNGFFFSSVEERNDMETGKITIQGQEFTYQDKEFPIWIEYSIRGFKISGETTFKHFPWIKHYKNLEDFYTSTGWDTNEKKFANKYLYMAFNHLLKRQCLLFSPTKIKPTGSEAWRCK